jgi:hypothetical protein
VFLVFLAVIHRGSGGMFNTLKRTGDGAEPEFMKLACTFCKRDEVYPEESI